MSLIRAPRRMGAIMAGSIDASQVIVLARPRRAAVLFRDGIGTVVGKEPEVVERPSAREAVRRDPAHGLDGRWENVRFHGCPPLHFGRRRREAAIFVLRSFRRHVVPKKSF